MSDDPYNDCLQAMMAAVRTLTDFFPKDYQVSTNHDEKSRGGDYWFICTPGAFPSTRLDGRDKTFQWQTTCDLYVRYTTEEESVQKLIAVRGAIIKKLHAPRALRNLNINNVTVSGNNLQQDMPGDNPNYIIQPLIVTIEQIVTS